MEGNAYLRGFQTVKGVLICDFLYDATFGR